MHCWNEHRFAVVAVGGLCVFETLNMGSEIRCRCVAVCCSGLLCVAGCCRVLQGVAGVAGCCSLLQCGSVLQCVAVCCSVLQCVAVCYHVLQFLAR